MSIKKIILFLSFISFFFCDDVKDNPPEIISELKCGKSSPNKEQDCTKYGTGSGMLCCWVAEEKGKEGSCYLIPETIADESGINGEKQFENKTYWSCGNKSTFLNINIIIIVLILFSL